MVAIARHFGDEAAFFRLPASPEHAQIMDGLKAVMVDRRFERSILLPRWNGFPIVFRLVRSPGASVDPLVAHHRLSPNGGEALILTVDISTAISRYYDDLELEKANAWCLEASALAPHAPSEAQVRRLFLYSSFLRSLLDHHLSISSSRRLWAKISAEAEDPQGNWTSTPIVTLIQRYFATADPNEVNMAFEAFKAAVEGLHQPEAALLQSLLQEPGRMAMYAIHHGVIHGTLSYRDIYPTRSWKRIVEKVRKSHTVNRIFRRLAKCCHKSYVLMLTGATTAGVPFEATITPRLLAFLKIPMVEMHQIFE